MKTKIIIVALLISTAILSAQEANKKTTIRVKKIVNVNGVEKISDSTYMVDGPVSIDNLEELTGNEKPKSKGTVIITDELHDGDFITLDQDKIKSKGTVIITNELHGENVSVLTELDEEMKNALKAAGLDGDKIEIDKILKLNDEELSEKSKITSTKIIIIKDMNISAANAEEKKAMEKTTGNIDQKLKVDQIMLYPNPSNGKFNFNITLKEKGNTEISILNSEGKIIFNEELKNFSGIYNKEMDLSNNPKGIYFLKIKQGEHSQLKKIILN